MVNETPETEAAKDAAKPGEGAEKPELVTKFGISGVYVSCRRSGTRMSFKAPNQRFRGRTLISMSMLR